MRRRRSRNRSEGPSVIVGIFAMMVKSVLIVVTLAAVAEIGAGLLLERLRRSSVLAQDAGRDEDLIRLYDTATPQTYREILVEQGQLVRTHYAPLLDYKMAPAQGRYYTVDEAGVRSNGGDEVPDGAGKVFVFGNSTVLGRGVANHETLPAQMEELLKAAGKGARVLNLGVVDYGIEQERMWLEQLLLQGQRPDLAVFVDGLMEFAHCRPGPVSAWSFRLASLTSDMSDLADDFRPHVMQLYQWYHGGREIKAGHWGLPCDDEAAVQARIDRMQGNRKLVQALADRYGFKVLFVQQPVPVHHYDNGRRPVRVNAEQLGQSMNAARGYARMAEWQANQQWPEPAPLWLADVEPPEGNAYIDPVHYSPRFNRALAEAIVRHALDQHLLP